jgi:anti-sigma factor RsiW
MKCEEAHELITALVDEELSHLERASIEAHLEDCPRCRWAYEREQALKREIHKVGVSISVPADLKRRILTDHGIPPKELESTRGWNKMVLPFRPLLRSAFGLALLLIVLLPMIYLMQSHSQPISLAALEIQEKIMGGELSLRTTKTQYELRDWQIRAVNGKFAPMGYDLLPKHFQPVGGVVQDVNGRKMLVTVYKGTGISVTCFTFLGTEEDALKDAAVVFDHGRNINFYTFSRNGYNAVLHRKDNLICILVSKMLTEELLDLARVKAHQA